MANITVSVTDANNITVQLTPVAAQNVTIDRGVAGNGISSIVPVTISTLQYLRIFYTNGTQQDVGPLTSTAYFGETPITIVGNTISLSTVPINKGGTNAITAAAAIQNLLPSYTGNGSKRLGLNSGATALEWVADGGGTVTSVDVSGGTTGLTTSGGPITGSGTITLAGTLAVANGGTGVTTSTGTGSVVLSTSPSLVTPLLGTPTSGNFSTGTFTWPTFNQNTTGTAAGLSATLVIASGGTNGTATPTAGAVPYGTGTAYAFTAAGTAGQILQSNGASAPTWANLSTLGVSSFSAGTTGFTPSTATTGAVTLAGTLNAVNGGTGQSSYAVGDLLYASTTTGLSKLADVATGNALISGGVGVAPAWGKIALTTHVSGVLPTANGGTNLSSFTANGIVYASSTSALNTGSSLTFDGSVFQTSGVVRASSGANQGFEAGWSSGASYVYVQAYDRTASTFQPLALTASNIQFLAGSSPSEQMRLTTTGLGIGTSSPGAKLDVSGSNAGSVLQSRILNTSTSASSDAQQFIYVNGGTAGDPYTTWTVAGVTSWSAGIRNSDSDSWYLSPGGNLGTTPSLVVTTSGNLGIGATAPQNKLQVVTTTRPQFSVSYNGTTGLYLEDATNSSWKSWKLSTSFGNGSDLSFVQSTNTSGTPTWAATAAMTLDASGNVGIGTSSPAGKLHVVGAQNAWSQVIAGNTTSGQSYGMRIQAGTNASDFSLLVRDATNTNTYLAIDGSGNLGLGVTPSAWGGAYKAIEFPGISLANLNGGTNQQAQYLLNAYDSSAGAWKYKITGAGAAMYRQSADGSHEWHRAASGTAGNAISFTQAMTLNASGYLAIGDQTSPTTRVDIRGTSANVASTVQIVGTGVSTLLLGQNSDGGVVRGQGGNNCLTFWTGGVGDTAASGSGSERARIDSNGAFLVGKSVTGIATQGFAMRMNADGNSGYNLLQISAGVSTNTYSCYDMYSTGAGTYRFYVGWGGTVYATSTTISAISDQRLKENIRDLDDGLASVMALKPRKFDWKEGKGANIKDARGFIAQEFETVFPDMIDEWRDPAPEGEEPYKAINANLIPTLVKAIQEQQAIITQLQADVALLKGA